MFVCACPFGLLDGPPSHQTQRMFNCSEKLSRGEEPVLVEMPYSSFPSMCQMKTIMYVGL
jgi:hypothetical protein